MFLSNVGCHVSFGENAATWMIDLAYIKNNPMMFPLPAGVVISQRNPGFSKKTSNCFTDLQALRGYRLWFLGVLFYFPKHAFMFLISVSLNLDLGALIYIYIHIHMHISTQHVCIKTHIKNIQSHCPLAQSKSLPKKSAPRALDLKTGLGMGFHGGWAPN